MIPEKVKDLIPEFCEQSGYDPLHVDIVINELFTDIRHHFKVMDFDKIRVPVLGTFFIKVWSLAREIKKSESISVSEKMKNVVRDIHATEAARLKGIYERVSTTFYRKMDEKTIRMDKLRENRRKKEAGETVKKERAVVKVPKGRKKKYDDNIEHVCPDLKPSGYTYAIKKCRCRECRDIMAVKAKQYYDAKRKAKEGLGEQGADS